MMHPTHKKTGIAFTMASIPLVQSIGLFPTYRGTLESILEIALFLVVALKAGVWGSGYPDFDSPGSIPANESYINKLLSFVMLAVGVKHRGRFTHSLDSIILTFLGAYLVVAYWLPNEVTSILVHGSVNNDMSIFLMLALKGHIINTLLQTWVVFAFIGAVSHLFADSSTSEGIRIFMWQSRSYPWVPAKFSVLGWKPFRHVFNANTDFWEYMIFSKIMTACIYVFGFLTVTSVFGLTGLHNLFYKYI